MTTDFVTLLMHKQAVDGVETDREMNLDKVRLSIDVHHLVLSKYLKKIVADCHADLFPRHK